MFSVCVHCDMRPTIPLVSTATTSRLDPLLFLLFSFSFLCWEHFRSYFPGKFHVNFITISLQFLCLLAWRCYPQPCFSYAEKWIIVSHFIPQPSYPGQERPSHCLPLTTRIRTPVTWATWSQCPSLWARISGFCLMIGQTGSYMSIFLPSHCQGCFLLMDSGW